MKGDITFSVESKTLDRVARWVVGVSFVVIILSFGVMTYAVIPNPGHSSTDIDFTQVTITSDTTLAANQMSVLADATSNSITLTLPSASANPDAVFWVKKADESLANIVTIAPGAGDTVEGLSSITLANRGESVTLQSDGSSNWHVLARRAYDVSGYRAKGSTLNQWYSSPNNGSGLTTGAPTADVLRAIPFVVSKTSTIDQLAIRVTTRVTGSFARVGIYADDGNDYPGDLIVEATSATQMNTGATGVKVATDGLPVTLDPGLYWLAYVSSAAPTIRSFSVAFMIPVLGVDQLLGTAQSFGWSVSYAYAALPAPFPAGGSPITAVPIPAIFARVSQ